VGDVHNKRVRHILKKYFGIFDSGQGGLTVWQQLVGKYPNINALYLGDNARYPYGNKTQATLIHYGSKALDFLKSQGTTTVLVACGTQSCAALPFLQKHFEPLPIVGIVDVLCQHVLKIQPLGPVAILGTRYTIHSKTFNQALQALGVENLWTQACPLFVPMVEEGLAHQAPLMHPLYSHYLQHLPQDACVLLLACTHYPRLIPTLAPWLHGFLKQRPIFYQDACLIPGSGQPLHVLEASQGLLDYVDQQLAADPESYWGGQQRIFCTDGADHFSRMAQIFTPGVDLPHVIQVDL